MAVSPVVQMFGIEKRFGEVQALKGVDLEVREREVHALLGENGAGKTTLMRILAGELGPDKGTVTINGQVVNRFSPSEAQKRGVGFVAQNFRLVPTLTVEENLSLSLPTKALCERAKRLAQELGWARGWDDEVASLSLGERQRLEIARVLAKEPQILILDEPTASLSPLEVEGFFSLLKGPAFDGMSVVFITHRLGEVAQVADRVTILRQGQKVGTFSGSTPIDRLAEMMVGPIEVRTNEQNRMKEPGQLLLVVKGLWVRSDRGTWAVEEAHLTVQEGEIVGIAGVDGNGQRELLEALWGIRPLQKGEVWLDGQPIQPHPSLWWTKGVAFLPPEPTRSLTFLSWSLKENALVRIRNRLSFLLDRRSASSLAEQWRSTFSIQADRIDRKVEELSGGNRQRWGIAMAMGLPARLLLLANPTQGLDVAGAAFVRRLILQKRDDGCGILLVSSDLDEVLDLSDRVFVISRGRLHRTEAKTAQEVGLLMGGVTVH
ncbi:MAG: ATP-binding cassette domain-containing protein [Armatimonadetes bacterium]|nr:ATP-binding cassette domain-containing protein [Armatimonadota bacterium]MDW8121256.1 ATP-binding cassette domain-containing protein [Armatimonadota bacterium]